MLINLNLYDKDKKQFRYNQDFRKDNQKLFSSFGFYTNKIRLLNSKKLEFQRIESCDNCFSKEYTIPHQILLLVFFSLQIIHIIPLFNFDCLHFQIYLQLSWIKICLIISISIDLMQQAIQELIQSSYCKKVIPLLNQQPLGTIPSSTLSTSQFLFSYQNRVAIPIQKNHFLCPMQKRQQYTNNKGKQRTIRQGNNELKIISQYQFTEYSMQIVETEYSYAHRYFGLWTQQNFLSEQVTQIDDERVIPFFGEKNYHVGLCGFVKKTQSGTIVLPITNKLIKEINKRIFKEVGSIKLSKFVLQKGNQNLGEDGVKILISYDDIFVQLAELSLWWNNLGVQGFRLLSTRNFETLKILDLRKNYIGQTGFHLFTQMYLPCLETLLFSDNNIVSTALIQPTKIPILSSIDLQNNKIDDNGITQISLISSLIILNINSNLLKGLKPLHSLSFSGIKYLYLASNGLESCQFLAKADLRSLKFLSLYNNKICWITMSFKKSLIPELEQLWLQKNYVKEFNLDESSLPNLKLCRLEFDFNDLVLNENYIWLIKPQFVPNLQKISKSLIKKEIASKARMKYGKYLCKYISTKINSNLKFFFAEN